MNLINVPILDHQLFAGRPIDMGEVRIIGYRYLPTPKDATAYDQFFVAKVCGDSLIEERIADGDWIMFKSTRRAEVGQLTVFATPHGLTAKFYFPKPDGTVNLVSANKKHKKQVWLAAEIKVEGIVVASGRDWE